MELPIVAAIIVVLVMLLFTKIIYDRYKALKETLSNYNWWVIGRKILGLIVVGFLFGAPSLLAQKGTPNPAQNEERANMLIMSGKYGEAIPYVEKVLKEVEQIDDPELMKQIAPMVERLEFLLGFCHLAAGKFGEAITLFDKFAADWPKSNRLQQALSMKAYSQSASKDWDGTVKSLTKMLEKYRILPAERHEALLMAGRALIEQKKYREAFSPLRDVLIGAQDPALRMSGMTEMLEVLTNLNDSKLLYQLVVILQGRISPARYSFTFNLEAIKAADKLFEEEKYADAFVLLKLCEERESLQVGLDQVEVHLHGQVAQLKAASLMKAFQRITANDRRLKLVAAEKKALAGADDYTQGLRMRIAQVLVKMDRLYESFWAYLSFYQSFPDSKQAPGALFGAASIAGELGLKERALKLGYEFLEKYPDSEYASKVSFTIAYTHKADGDLGKAIEVLEKGLDAGLFKDSEDKGHAFFLIGHCELYQDDYDAGLKWFDKLRAEAPQCSHREDADYWTGYIQLGLGEFMDAAEKYRKFVETYPGGGYFEDASYRLSLAMFGAQEYELAYDAVKVFLKKFPTSLLRGDAQNVLGDICGALGKLDEAIESYNLVEDFTTDPGQTHTAVFSAAKVMETDGRWEQLLVHLQQYLDRYGNEGRYSMAVYQMGSALENMGRVDEMLALYWKTFERFQDDPHAMGADFLLRDYIKKYPENEVSKALAELEAERKAKRAALTEEEREALDKAYEIMPPEEREALAKALAEETEKRRTEAEEDAHAAVLAVVRAALDAVDRSQKPTAWLRLLWGLGLAGDTSRVPESFSAEEIAAGSPAVLVWIGGQLQEKGDLKAAAAAFRQTVENFPDTSWTVDAMYQLGEMEFAQGNLDAAESYFYDLYERFPTVELAGNAVMRYADVLVLKKRLPEAIEAYESIVMAKEWRGPLWPEALYKTGRAVMDSGDAQKASAYFQRVYVLYGQHVEWVAKAYLDAGECLEKLERKAEAAATYQEMLDIESLKDRPEAKEAAERMKSLPPPPAPAQPTTTGETNGN